jgi:hypothetical protein
MKFLSSVVVMILASCAAVPAEDAGVRTLQNFTTSIPHAPKLDGYKQMKSQAVEFRKYRVFHPDGLWTVRLDAEDDPIAVTLPSGKSFSFKDEWYPLEGGADATEVYGFTKGDVTLIILEGTSSITYEETRITFTGDQMTEIRRYAEKGEGMGKDAPGEEPKYREYPPR